MFVFFANFQLACRSGLECRAVSLCESMPSVDVVKLASKYAAKLGRHQLASRVSQVAARLSEEENNRYFAKLFIQFKLVVAFTLYKFQY